ncbi:hypothetical protein [Pseudoalteromonas prydzensis]|uniref:hypothetical protein n=1 Tax=Pseudoalteromonas prydzensis TaxID=182141 RepID=UPI0007E4FAEA|nr:hypothetical protein [Pseudoalteromonas prydzensis]MBE0377771.1 hypothetical protein [Pseudoalteromonas prydzensis ACAM 620]
MTSKIELNILAAEAAVKELLAEGKRVNQHSVEKVAGLSNGTLNYKCEPYEKFKNRLIKINEPKIQVDEQQKKLKKEVARQAELKDKYRIQRDELRQENVELHAENKELLHQLFLLQKEMIAIKETNVVDFTVLRFKKED